MKHFITSNFNLMHSNNAWDTIKKKYNSLVDHNFNYYFFAIKNKEYLKKYDSFHVFLYLDESNWVETRKKFLFLKN